MQNIVAAVFDDRLTAERAITGLREMGVPDSAISVIAMDDDPVAAHPDAVVDMTDHDTKASGAAKGVVAGAAVGAIFGLAAAFIPGVGPFIAAGALAQALGTAGATAVAGAVVGATAGGLTGLIENYGVDRVDAEYFAQEVGRGKVFLAVNTSTVPPEVVRGVFTSAGGRFGAYMA